MVPVILSLGSNTGNREDCMAAMEEKLDKLLQGPLMKSRLMETEPVDVVKEQPWYLNRIIKGYYSSTARELLNRCLVIEAELGRERPSPKAPRTADIDILLFGEEIINECGLTVPHPALLRRRFILEGLLEVAPDLCIPGICLSVRDVISQISPEVRMQKIRTMNTG